ncbi:hypothetical protein B0H66DRAFT_258022 [Apodospora peruviana]|uniref:Heterokaryon incompatibility domain-containing protein n=1 Tax=Apodospora peruviana TaxID=516989 RepID=A0AAE0M5Y9_9PEZI|nr:hypothetical protein B0H66DRAFT_258022 [Apodospora peruviana]
MGEIVVVSAQQDGHLTDLEAFWVEENPENLRCCRCGRTFDGDALIRTFRITNQGEEGGYHDTNNASCSKFIMALNERISLFNRHMECLISEKTSYVAVSHVWDSEISNTQARGRHSPQDTHIRQRVFASVIGIAHGLMASQNDAEVEIWHDYFSVPQWEDDLKNQILLAIPLVFQHADFTLVNMNDVRIENVNALLHGHSTEDRLNAITSICGAAWFKRVWTVMEFIRARRVRAMVHGNQLVDESVGDVFLGKLSEVWDRESETHGAKEVEERTRVGTNLVPWNLGPLQAARDLRKLDFASTWILLSRRGCRSIHDFFHAFLGILRTSLPPEQILEKEDASKACLQIATACLTAGDYSPLLMTPTAEPYDRRGEWRRMTRDGFNDVTTFGLGHQTSGPAFHQDFVLGSDSGLPHLKVARIGKVSFVFKSPRYTDALETWTHTAQTVLSFTGPNVDRFVTTVCSRLYGQADDEASEILSDHERRQKLEVILRDWYNAWPDEAPDPAVTQRLAELLYLSRLSPSSQTPGGLTPFTFLQMHGGTIHMGWFGGLIGVTCATCCETFLYRTAFYKPPAEIRNGVVAYRIPGLDYIFTRMDGVGLLVDEKRRIVGRMNWATPTCRCDVVMEMVEVEIPDFYSVVTEEWLPT